MQMMTDRVNNASELNVPLYLKKNPYKYVNRTHTYTHSLSHQHIPSRPMLH